MSVAEAFPWLTAAIGLLDVRRNDRLLACGVGIGAARALAAQVGKAGELVFVCGAAAAAPIAALDLEHVRVLAHALVGDEQFGTFDALLLCPLTGPLLPVGAHVDLARANLRPGGRLVIDLPGIDMVPALTAAFAAAGFDPERATPLRGIADDELATSLRSGGLRDVHAVLGAHLLHLACPADLVAAFAPYLGLAATEELELARALVRRQGGTGPMDALVHRTRVLALR